VFIAHLPEAGDEKGREQKKKEKKFCLQFKFSITFLGFLFSLFPPSSDLFRVRVN
jgi:hypothetical protein